MVLGTEHGLIPHPAIPQERSHRHDGLACHM